MSNSISLISLHVTEKSNLLQSLWESESNKSIKRFKSRKYLFKIHRSATKSNVKRDVESLYSVKVAKVNVINLPGKKKKVRGKNRYGITSRIKKVIVTLKEGDQIDF